MLLSLIALAGFSLSAQNIYHDEQVTVDKIEKGTYKINYRDAPNTFLAKSALMGLFSAFLAIIMLLGILFFVRNEFPQLFDIFRLDLLLLVIGIVIVSGLVICVVSTYFVVGKLVSLSNDELYY